MERKFKNVVKQVQHNLMSRLLLPLTVFLLCFALKTVRCNQHVTIKELKAQSQDSWVLVPDVALTLCMTWKNTSVTLGPISKIEPPLCPTYFTKVLMKKE